MTDRELLELAAKAAGYEVEWSNITECFWGDGDSWVPLDDDTDALRLAVKLHINLDFESYCVEAQTMMGGVDIRVCEFVSKEFPIENATRKAIVKAAANIGETM